MNQTYSLAVKLFLHHVPRFRKMEMLPLMEDLLREGFGDVFIQFDSLNSAERKTLLQELKASDKELAKYRFNGGVLENKTSRNRNRYINTSGGLLSYLKFTRTLLQSTPVAGTPNKKDSPTNKPVMRSWFAPPRYDLRPLAEGKRLLVNATRANLDTVIDRVKKTGYSLTKPVQLLVKNFAKFEKIGVFAIKDMALVLVAGGLGERMQSKTTKIDRKVHHLRHSKIENHSFFGYYLETILALEAHYYAQTGKRTHIPLMVMCTEHNYKNIVKVVKKYTGKKKLIPGQVQVCKQLLAPCLTGEGEVAITKSKTKDKLIKKPLGHGFVHTIIHEEGYLERLKIQKKPYLLFLQDSNPQVVNTLLSSLGMMKSHRPGFLWITVERHVGEAAGVIVGARTKTRNQSVRQVINIEYNEIPPKLNRSANKENALTANTNNFWITTSAYKQALKKTSGLLPYMMNPKKSSDGKIAPVRPESLMQDLAKHLFLAPPQMRRAKPSQASLPRIGGIKTVKALIENVTTVTYPRYLSFSPVKKPLVFPAITKPRSNGIVSMPKYWEYTALELEINHNLSTLITMAVNNILLWSTFGRNKKNSLSYSEEICAYLSSFPKIVLPPRYLLSNKHLHTHIRNCTFYPGSFLYIEDDGVILDGVTLHSGAALIIHGKKARSFEVRDLVVEKQGFSYEPLKKNRQYSEEENNRGHCIVWKNPMVIDIVKSKKFRID